MPTRIEERTQVFLFGSFELRVGDRLIHLPTRKMEALLAYLILHPGVQSRERMASIFWGDSPEELARRSLRTALAALRKEIGEQFIISDRETLQLNPAFPIWVDVSEIEKQAKQILAANGHPALGMDLDLYRADLLQDFYDEWVLEERAHYRNVFVRALSHFAQSLKTHGDYLRTISVAQKIISIDPLNEPAYQHLIFCYGALGDRTEALKSYEECARRFRDQFGMEPSEATVALIEQVKATDTSTPENITSNLPIPLTSFIGREQELKTLGAIFTRTRLLT